MSFQPRFRDVAHLGHIELLTPKLQESLEFFTKIVGLYESGRQGNSVYLRAWGDYEFATLKLTASQTPGVGHFAFRTANAETLEQLADHLQQNDVSGKWIESDLGHGRAYRFPSPDGHSVELYYDTQLFEAPASLITHLKNNPQRRGLHGVAPRRLDHINLLAADVSANRQFYQTMLGMKVTEQIIFDDGTEMGGWLTATNKSYDLAITRDNTGGHGRLHHLTYFTDTREEVLRAADLLVENGITIETGPHKHAIGQTFFLYVFEPGGNRFELASGGYTILAPDWKPIVWTQSDRARGQAWGLKTVESFHTYGTPPIEH
jgi:catechol 2,3-dioxygenase